MLRPSGGLWRHSDFLAFWSAQSLSLLGIQFGRLALPLLAILAFQASATEVGLLLIAASSPGLIFGLFAGLVVDRLPRRAVLIAAHAGRGVLLGSLPVCALLGVLSLTQLYVTAFLAGVLDVAFQVAYRSYLPALVSPADLPDGYAKLAVTDGLMRTAGPSLAGFVVQVLGAAAALLGQALAYLCSGVLLWRIRHREPAEPVELAERRRIWSALLAGWAFIWRQPLVRAFTLSDAGFVYGFAVLYSVQLVFFTRDLGLSPVVIGVTFSVGSVGGLLGGLVARPLGDRLGAGRAIVAGSAMRAGGLALIPFAAVAGPLAVPLLVVARLVNAFGWTVWEVHQETTQQLLTPAGLRGRVNSSALFAVQAVDALGAATGAFLASRLGVLPTLAAGAVAAVLSVVFLATPALGSRRAQGH